MGWSEVEMVARHALAAGGAVAWALLAAVMLGLSACPPAAPDDEGTVVDGWDSVAAPPAPELADVTVSASNTALLVLDIQNNNCNEETRPRCVASIPQIAALLEQCRNHGVLVVYTLTSNASTEDIREEVCPRPDEPVVASGVDKFFRTNLETILNAEGVETVILVGTSAHGAVLNTATGAALRGFEVVVPIDGMSASEVYAEQYTAWHLANSPGTRRSTRLTTTARITIEP